MNEAARERLQAAAEAFEAEFLPPGARSSHQVLYDFDGELDHAPTAARLAEVLDAYRFLLEQVPEEPEETHLWLRLLLSASELALGLAGRAHDAGVRLDREILEPTCARARSLHERCLAATPEYAHVDGVKRVGRVAAVAELLADEEPQDPGAAPSA